MAISTNSRTNFNPRNSEPNSPMRRSFTGNPIQRSIHTNSPSENSRSSMVTEEKENEIKPRPPTVVNGISHFMLPTISAASKINPSPKKKVLSEKNEHIRISSGAINMSCFPKDFDQKLIDIGFNSPLSDTNHLPKCTSRNLHTPKKLESSDKRSIVNTKLFGSSISPIAPLDADPSSFPPYDPKTNYLSPRPRFLHYKPNPRLELYYQKDQSSSPKKLEDDFLSDSEESDYEFFHKESDEASLAQAINGSVEKDSEYASSVEVVKRTPVSTLVFESTSEEKKVIKSRFFTIRKVISLLLILLIACLSVSYTGSLIFNSPVYQNSSRSMFDEVGFNEFVRNMKLWSVSSKSYAKELISSIGGRVESNPLQFSNLTYVIENPFIKVKRAEEIVEHNEVEPFFSDGKELENDLNLQNEIDFKSCPEEAPEISFEEVASEVIVKGDGHLISESKIESSPAISSFENSYVITISNSEVLSLQRGDQTASDSEFEPTIVVSSSGNTFEIDSFQEDPEYKSEISEKTDIKVENSAISDFINGPTTLNQYEALTTLLAVALILTTLLAVAVIAFPALIYFKKKNSSTGIYTVDINRIPTKKMKKPNPSSQVYPSEVDCSSVISCFGKSHSHGKRGTWGISNGAHNQETKQKMVSKRESLASSTDFSMSDSPSYGSFTTYERLPIKHDFGEDEVITPVRRSIRINKIHATS